MATPEGFLLRAAREDDRAELGALKLRASLAWGEFVDQITAMPEAGELAAALLPDSFLVEADGVLAGFATVVPAGKHAELEELFVDPVFWRRGIGRLLVDEAVRRCAVAGVTVIHVVASRRAKGFYAACGFETAGEVMTQLEPALSMTKRVL